jgi:amidohydrolase
MTLQDPIALAKKLHQKTIAQRRDLHMHPEIGFDVERTAGIVAKKLRELGLKVKTKIGMSGVVADLIVPNANRTIALRADMDALPIQELNDVPYKSIIPMRAHLCGHDAHTSMLLAAAEILTLNKNQLKVNVRFIFQPNEEAWPGGAPAMIADGALDSVDEIYALHVWPTIDVGSYGICVGHAMAMPDAFDISVTGKSGHAATPHTSVNPINVGSQIIQALQALVPQHINAHDEAVLTVTQVHAGNCYNVIPDQCAITGTVRTYDVKVREKIREKMAQIVNGIARTYDAKAEVKYLEGYPATFNHEECCIKAKKATEELVKASNVIYPGQRAMFGEDFAYYTQKIPGCYIQLGCRNEKKVTPRMLHDSRFDIDEDCMIYGVAILVKIVTLNK